MTPADERRALSVGVWAGAGAAWGDWRVAVSREGSLTLTCVRSCRACVVNSSGSTRVAKYVGSCGRAAPARYVWPPLASSMSLHSIQTMRTRASIDTKCASMCQCVRRCHTRKHTIPAPYPSARRVGRGTSLRYCTNESVHVGIELKSIFPCISGCEFAESPLHTHKRGLPMRGG